MHLVRERAAFYGVRGVEPEKLSFDLAAAVKRKDGIVAGIHAGIYKALKHNENITFLRGQAELISPVDLRVDGTLIRAEKIILAVGAVQAPVPIEGLQEAGYLTNKEALKLEQVPESMIIIGGGYVGVEFAQMYARFGTKVTLLGRAARLMPKEEPELSEILAQILEAEGVEVHTGTTVARIERQEGKRVVYARADDAELQPEAQEVLLAAGRVARVQGLALEQAGVELSGSFIQVDEQLRTAAANIWSLGDANGGPMFTHRATYDGPIAALNAVRELARGVDYRAVPRAVFTEPALASVGLTEAQAREGGREIKIGRARFAHSGRAKAMAQTEGLVKLIADAETGELLGGHILGPHADILIHEVVVAMFKQGTFEALAKSIHVHPTLSEVIRSAARGLR